MVDKQELRKVYLDKRLRLSVSELQKRNTLIFVKLLRKIDLDQYRCIHSYLPIVEKNEADTNPIIHHLMSLSKLIVIPRTRPEAQMDHYYLNDNTTIRKNKWGIPEPIQGDPANINEIDLILVPMIIFDKTGHRIGYGKGIYDRFLKKIPRAMKVGLCLGPGLDKITYTDEHDVALDMCVTPFEVIRF